MDESAVKVIFFSLRGFFFKTHSLTYVDYSSFSSIFFEGYDTSLHEYDLKLALIKLFASCGEIFHIFVRRDFESGILKRFSASSSNFPSSKLSSVLFLLFSFGFTDAFIHIGLELSGSDSGGWNVLAKASPYDGQYADPRWATVESLGLQSSGTQVS